MRLPLALLLALALAACGSSTAPADATVDTAHDAADAADRPDTGLGCSALSACVGACADAACVSACQSVANPRAIELLRAQIACVFGSTTATPPVAGVCANTNGGPCDSAAPGYTAARCEACITAAQRPGGACDAAVSACQRFVG